MRLRALGSHPGGSAAPLDPAHFCDAFTGFDPRRRNRACLHEIIAGILERRLPRLELHVACAQAYGLSTDNRSAHNQVAEQRTGCVLGVAKRRALRIFANLRRQKKSLATLAISGCSRLFPLRLWKPRRVLADA